MDPDSILSYLQNKTVMDQARGIHSNLMSLPKPPDTGSTIKDFLLNALQTAPNAIGARIPRPSIIGGKDYGIMDGTYSSIHNPGSAMDLSLKMGGSSPPFNRLAPGQGPEINTPANSNKFNPKVNDVLSYLSNRDLPVMGVKDPPGGSTYITTQNPTRPEGKNEIRIRIPEPGNEHPPRGDVTFKYQQRNGPGSFFDVNSKGLTGAAGKILKENESGGKYSDLDNLYSAIDKVTGKKLVPEGKGPILSKPEKIIEPPKENLNIDDLITSTLKDMEQPKFNPRANTTPGFDYAPGGKQTLSKNIGEAANVNKLHEDIDSWASQWKPKIDNINQPQELMKLDKYGFEPPEHLPKYWHKELTTRPQRSSDLAPMQFDPTEMVASNTGKKPVVPDLLTDLMLKSDSGKYSLAQMKQQLSKKGIDSEGMSFMQMFKELNPDLFGK